MSQQIAHKLDDESIIRTSDVLICGNVSFAKMMLSDAVLLGLTKAGFSKPSPIQLRAIPLGRSGLDLLIRAKSGTGKTLVFATIILEAFRPNITAPQSLILVPTREIAVQIESVLTQIGYAVQGFNVGSFIGGLDIIDDRKKIANCRAIVGTPGRIKHLITNGILNTEKIKLLVLDEADKLMNDTFRADIDWICKQLPVKRQVLAVSATFENGLDELLQNYMKSPIGVTPQKDAPPVLLGVKQFAYEMYAKDDETVAEAKSSMTEMNEKLKTLQMIFSTIPFKQCLVFSNSQSRAESYCNYLTRNGWPADVIMGNQKQSVRLEIFRKFRKFECRILVATDLMARGIDSENVNLVVNLDVPDDAAVYLHRIGRCGRFGSQGIAITLLGSLDCLVKFRKMLGTIGGRKMSVLKFNFELVADIWAAIGDPTEERKLFGEICGVDETEVLELEKTKNSQHGTLMSGRKAVDDKEAEIIEKNLALLSISRLLVDQPGSDSKAKEMDDLFDNYNATVATQIEAENRHENIEPYLISQLLVDEPVTDSKSHQMDDLFDNYTMTIGSQNATEKIEPNLLSQLLVDPPESDLQKEDLFENYNKSIAAQNPPENHRDEIEPNALSQLLVDQQAPDSKPQQMDDLFENYSAAIATQKATLNQMDPNLLSQLLNDPPETAPTPHQKENTSVSTQNGTQNPHDTINPPHLISKLLIDPPASDSSTQQTDDLFDNYSMAVNCSTKSANTTAMSQTTETKIDPLPNPVQINATNSIFLDAIARLNLYPEDNIPSIIEKHDNLSTSVKDTVGTSSTTSRKSASTDRDKVLEIDNPDNIENFSTSSSDDEEDDIANGDCDYEISDDSSEECDETSDNDEAAEEYEKCQQQQMAANHFYKPNSQNQREKLWNELYNRQVRHITDYVNYTKGMHWFNH